MIMIMKKIKYLFLIFISTMSFSACSDYFNPDSDDTLKEDDYIGEKGELYSGYMGLAACVQEVADQAPFIEGLRGDLLEPTSNAPKEIWDVYNYSDVNNNTFADPKGYYKIIMNANDYIEHVFKYKAKNPNAVSSTTYDGIIGGAIRYKVWAYMMLAKNYGEAVYFDDALSSYTDISKYPLLKFDEIIEKCESLIETGVNGISGKGVVQWSSELFPTQGQSPTSLSWDRICPPAECLLAEIYLYQNKFQKAKENCIELIRKGGVEASYQLNLSEYNGEWKKFGYTFTRMEHIAVAFYDYSLKQTNRYIQYYSNTYPNKYYLRPTAVGMDRFAKQTNAGGVLNDRYRGEGVTYKKVNGEWVLQKFLLGNLTSDLIYRNDVLIALYRASDIHLFLIEALVGLGQFEQALAFFNDGVGSYYNATDGKFMHPFEEYPSTLYVTTSAGNKSNRGVRGRVDLSNVGKFSLNSVSALDTLVSINRLDSLIVEEFSLESAGEAKAYYAMNRMARRWSNTASKDWASKWINKAVSEGKNPSELWNNTVRSVWASKVGAKYTNGKGPSIASNLASDPDAWFMKFNLIK